jgi:glycosyltransferase involved in cell wall biosynthesis
VNVLHVTSNLNPLRGGPVSALIGLACAQSQTGMEVTVVVNHDRGVEDVSELENAGIEVVFLAPPVPAFRASQSSLQQLESTIKHADIVHIHGLWEEPQHQAAVLARKCKKPYLIRPCGMLDPWCLNQKRWKKQLYYQWRQKEDLNQAAALHFTSQLEQGGSSCLGLKSRSIIEPNGVNLKKFNSLPPVNLFRARFLPKTGQRYIAFVGRIHPIKGLDLLIASLAALLFDDIMLCIIGPDEAGYQSQVEADIKHRSLTGKIIFTGMLRDDILLSALRGAELFVLPSYHENFGNAVIEALACGTPVVVSDQINIHAEITKAQVGQVVPLSADILSKELSRWLSDDALRNAAAQRARPFVQSRYDWNEIAERWKRHYEVIV